MKKIQVGLIGFGMAGRVFHAPIISSVPGFNLHSVTTSKPESAEIIRQKYPQATIKTRAEEVFADAAIDLVVIATPTHSHFELAQKALAAGKHVLVDKPFTVTSQQAEELIQLAQAQDKLLTVFQNRRWDSDFKTVKKVIESGLLGQLVELEVHFDRFRNYIKGGTWKEEDVDGAGTLYDLGVHLVDQAVTLFGNPQAVTADIRAQRPQSRVIDNFEMILHYPQLKVTLKSGYLVKQPGPHFILLGDKGSFVKQGMDVQEEQLNNGMTPLEPGFGKEPEELWGTISTEYEGLEINGKITSEIGSYIDLYKNIAGVINNGESLIVTPQQAKTNIRIIELALQSQAERRTVEF
ncbi:oxidoreductase [Pedobacter sp. BS3]|uniref:Gfo/Idh/MocA family oxidoreductase n=1 Tax=Pedobacter sp. BS3 TaxID=2567937 RepID=UPI0011ED8907|nr:Gfo/Idh/MocA family oxidoreductase [Pedobacter sp. BS3]TZF81503.1 oxidoreductase [Pedobacter sp. BS3]